MTTTKTIRPTAVPWYAEDTHGVRPVGKATCGHEGCQEHRPVEPALNGIQVWHKRPTPDANGDSLHWVADFHGEHLGIGADECRANALLFMQAPWMLAALRGIMREFDHGRPLSIAHLAAARAAIRPLEHVLPPVDEGVAATVAGAA